MRPSLDPTKRDRHLRLAIDFRELRRAIPGETVEKPPSMADSSQLYPTAKMPKAQTNMIRAEDCVSDDVGIAYNLGLESTAS